MGPWIRWREGPAHGPPSEPSQNQGWCRLLPSPFNHLPILPLKGLVEGGTGHPDRDPHLRLLQSHLAELPARSGILGVQMKWGVNGALESSGVRGGAERTDRGEAHLASGVSHLLQSLL